MNRVGIVDAEGKIVPPEELSTAAELQQAAEQARNLIRHCERLAHAMVPKNTAAQKTQVPYS